MNEHLESSIPGIYAAGDANGRYMLQHAASFEVQYLRNQLLKGSTDPIDNRHIAYAIFSHPEVASVGFTEEALKKSGTCLLYTSPSPRDATLSRMPSSA